MADDDLPTTAEEHVVDEQPQTDVGPLEPTSSESPVESRAATARALRAGDEGASRRAA